MNTNGVTPAISRDLAVELEAVAQWARRIEDECYEVVKRLDGLLYEARTAAGVSDEDADAWRAALRAEGAEKAKSFQAGA